MHQHEPRRVLWALGMVLATTVVLAGCGSSKSATPSQPTTRTSSTTAARKRLALSGTYAQPAVTPENYTPNAAKTEATYTVHSGTAWHGDLEGTTKLVMNGTSDMKTLADSGTIDEIFTGSIKGLGSGTLHFEESFSIDPKGVIAIDAHVIDGTKDLAGLEGTMHFAGTGDPVTGEGGGTYTAAFTE